MTDANKTPGLPSDACRIVWRRHFHAGLLVLPVLMLMALTGGLYPFKDEMDHPAHRPMTQLAPATAPASPERVEILAGRAIATGVRLAAPVAPPGPWAKTAVPAIVPPLAIVYPLTGLSLIVAVGLDRLVRRTTRPRTLAS